MLQKKPGGNISLIPYISAIHQNDLRDRKKANQTVEIGGDAKIALTPSLNMDITVNPDFSQVEVDQQVTNLTRFNIFFPERRQFFIENGDLFNSFGQFGNSPFYSRRIGLNNSGGTVPILYGLRLTGNIDSKTRIGLFNMHSKESGNQSAQNYSSIAFERRIGQRSSIKGIFLNRQSFDGSEIIDNDFGRNFGGEINLSTPNGKWRGEAGWIQSDKNGITTDNTHQYGRIDYDGQRFRTFLTLQKVGGNYFADIGFNNRVLQFDPTTQTITRRGYIQALNMVNYYIYPENHPKVNYHWSGIENIVYWYNSGRLNEWYTRFRHFIFFENTSQLRFRLNHHFVDLLFPFGITEVPLPAGEYDMWEFNVQTNSDLRKQLSFELFSVYGEFYAGTKLTNELAVNLRVQPWLNVNVGLNRNDIWFPEPYGNTDITLVQSRVEINFTTQLFWTTFFQYNTQIDNFNVNSRLQWRFAPMSDLFLVYTDNYTIEGLFGPKNRSLVLKCNYWLTI